MRFPTMRYVQPTKPHTHSLIRVFAGRLSILRLNKLLTEHHLKFLSLKGGCRGSSENTLVKMSNCCKSHVAAQLCHSDLSSPD